MLQETGFIKWASSSGSQVCPYLLTKVHFINHKRVPVSQVGCCVCTLLLLHAFMMHNSGGEGFTKCCSSSTFTVCAWKSHNRSFYKPQVRSFPQVGCCVCMYIAAASGVCAVSFFWLQGSNWKALKHLVGLSPGHPKWLTRVPYYAFWWSRPKI